MRYSLLALAVAIGAPAAASPPPPQPFEVPPELTDPAFADRLANMTEALGRAMLDLPVGAIEAAAEGRQPTRADEQLTMRDIGRRDDPDFDRNFDRQIAESRPMIRQSMQGFAQALPAMTSALATAAAEFERATADLARPGQPKR